MIVYKTTNLINGKCYVGKDSKNRSEYLGSGIYLNNSIKKCGRENFKKETIACGYTKENLNWLEKFYIQYFNTKAHCGYNLTDGGDGASLGHQHTEETKRKIGKGNQGKIILPEVRTKLSKAMAGMKHPRVSESNRQRIGETRSEETCVKISEAKTGKKRPDIVGDKNPNYRHGGYCKGR